MKRLKKMMALIITTAMVLGLSGTVFAAETHSITITPKDTAEHTFEAYQILTFNVTTDAGGGKVPAYHEWGTGIDSSALKTTIKSIYAEAPYNTVPAADGSGFVADKFSSITASSSATDLVNAFFNAFGNLRDDGPGAQELAALYAQHLTNTHIDSGAKQADGTYVISGLPSGYYLIKDKKDSLTEKDGASTRYMLIQMMDEDLTAEAKSDVPSVEKKVYESEHTSDDNSAIDSSIKLGTGFNDVADYDIGDIITFEVLGTVADNYDDYEAYYYAFEDTMSEGLTYYTDSDHRAKMEYYDGAEWIEIPAPNYSRTVVNNQIIVEFKVEGEKKGLKEISGITASSVIRMTYYAKLNSNAVIGLPGNTNTVKLQFSNNPNDKGWGEKGETPPDQVIVFTYKIDATKYKDSIANGNELAGASFVVKNEEGKFLKIEEGSGKTPPTYSWIEVDAPTGTDKNDLVTYYGTKNGVKVFTSAETTGTFEIKGLQDGKYTVVEIAAPAGYNLASDTEIQLTATTDHGQNWSGTPNTAMTAFIYTVNGTDNETTGDNVGKAKIDIIDMSGSVMPHTGGSGTTIFYVIGGILVAGAAVLLVVRRRMMER